MKIPLADPIMAEIRAVRERHAARFNYDIKTIFRDIQAMQMASGRKFVRYPPRRTDLESKDPTTPC